MKTLYFAMIIMTLQLVSLNSYASEDKKQFISKCEDLINQPREVQETFNDLRSKVGADLGWNLNCTDLYTAWESRTSIWLDGMQTFGFDLVDIEILSFLPNLKSLMIRSYQLHNFEKISKLDIVSMDLVGSNGVDCKPIEKLVNLIDVKIDARFSHCMPNELKKLEVVVSSSDNFYSYISRYKELEEFAAESFKDVYIHLELPKLRKLKLVGNIRFSFSDLISSPLNSIDLSSLTSEANIKEVLLFRDSLEEFKFFAGSLNHVGFLTKLNKLKKLSIYGGQFHGLTEEDFPTPLEELEVSYNAGFSDFRPRKNSPLKNLIFKRTGIRYILIGNLLNLENIEISESNLSTVAVSTWDKFTFPNLTSVNFKGNQLRNKYLIDFFGNNFFPKLTRVDLGENKITDISFLRDQKTISQLYIRDNKIQDISVLSGLEDLNFLDAQYNLLTDPVCPFEDEFKNRCKFQHQFE